MPLQIRQVLDGGPLGGVLATSIDGPLDGRVLAHRHATYLGRQVEIVNRLRHARVYIDGGPEGRGFDPVSAYFSGSLPTALVLSIVCVAGFEALQATSRCCRPVW